MNSHLILSPTSLTHTVGSWNESEIDLRNKFPRHRTNMEMLFVGNAWISNESNLIVHNWVQLLACSSFYRTLSLRDDGFVKIYSLGMRVHYSTVVTVTSDCINVENQLVSSFVCIKLNSNPRGWRFTVEFEGSICSIKGIKNGLDCVTFIRFLSSYTSNSIVTFTHHNYTYFISSLSNITLKPQIYSHHRVIR